MNDETKTENILSNEEILEALEKSFKWMIEQSEVIYGTKENPYICYVSDGAYKKIKEMSVLDKNDMCSTISGWIKVINVDKPFEVEVKPYEVKKEDNLFYNFINPYFLDLFKNKEKYSLKVVGKWKKRK